MSSYNIHRKHEVLTITEASGTVISASESLDWAIDLPFGYVRDYCRRKGWLVEPVIERDEPYSIELDGVLYVFTWRHGRVSTITKINGGKDKEIGPSELPQVLQQFLSNRYGKE